MTWSHGTKLAMMGQELRSGSSKTSRTGASFFVFAVYNLRPSMTDFVPCD